MFTIEVLTANGWEKVRPSHGDAYRFETRDDARRTLELCYPDQCREARLNGDHDYSGRERVRIVGGAS